MLLGFCWDLLTQKLLLRRSQTIKSKIFDDLILWIAVGTIIGGRLGYVFFYEFLYYMNNPVLIILDIRKGGMSFHGGLLGVILATLLFCKKGILVFLNAWI